MMLADTEMKLALINKNTVIVAKYLIVVFSLVFLPPFYIKYLDCIYKISFQKYTF